MQTRERLAGRIARNINPRLVVIPQGVVIAEVQTKHRGDLGIERNRGKVADVVTGNPLHRGEGIARAQHVRLLPDHERIADLEIKAWIESMLQHGVEIMRVAPMLIRVAARFVVILSRIRIRGAHERLVANPMDARPRIDLVAERLNLAVVRRLDVVVVESAQGHPDTPRLLGFEIRQPLRVSGVQGGSTQGNQSN